MSEDMKNNQSNDAEETEQTFEVPQEYEAKTAAPAQQSTPEAPQPEVSQPENPQPTPEPKQKKPETSEPNFIENGPFSFFLMDSDPDEDPQSLNWGFRASWFVLGLLAGMLGLIMTWISTASLSQELRRQALLATWLGFAMQAAIFLMLTLMGVMLPFMPGGFGSASQQAAPASPGTSSAFG